MVNTTKKEDLETEKNNQTILATYKIKESNTKGPDWKVVTIISPEGREIANVSVNRTNKKGEVFPNFDSITSGASIEATSWESESGKWYLFAPKPERASNGTTGGFKGGSGVKAAQERKAEMIEKAQDRKSESIAYFNATNSAISILAALFAGKEFRQTSGLSEALKNDISLWRDWFLSEWEKYNDPTNEAPF